MLEIVLPIFAMIGVGVLLRHFRILDEADGYKLVGLIVNVTYPATLFRAVVATSLPLSAWSVPLWAYLSMAAGIGLTYGYARLARLDRPATGSLVIASIFGNTGFLGVPFCFLAYGATGRITAVFYDFAVTTVPLYSLGFAALASFGGQVWTRKETLSFFRSPAFLTIFVALGVRFLTPWWGAHIPTPPVLGAAFRQTLDLLAPLTAPLAMIALGLNLRLRGVFEFLPSVAVASAAKVVVMPIVVYVCVHALGPRGVPGKTAVLEAAMPGGIVAGALCGRFGCNARLGAAITVGTTLAALLTLPLWAGLLGR